MWFSVSQCICDQRFDNATTNRFDVLNHADMYALACGFLMRRDVRNNVYILKHLMYFEPMRGDVATYADRKPVVCCCGLRCCMFTLLLYSTKRTALGEDGGGILW